jgi:hypothetical protein
VGLLASAEPAQAATVYSWQFNIAGGAKHNGDAFPSNFINALMDQTPANQRPFSITLNEVCGNQYTQMRVHLASYGYDHGRFVTKPSASSCGGQSYGTAVFAVGTHAGQSELTLTPTANDTANGESRKSGCIQTLWGGFFPFTACVVHLTNDRGEIWAGSGSPRYIVQRQGDEARAHSALIIGANWGAVGGDYNMRPEDYYLNWGDGRAMDGWYVTYAEAIGGTLPATSSGHETLGSYKIDYAFMDEAHTNAWPLPDETFPVWVFGFQVSDHNFVHGRYTT